MNRNMHPNAPPDVSRLDLYTAAFLTGGPARVADVAILAMRATGVLHIGRDGTVTATGRGPADPVAAGVLRAVQAAGGSAPLATVRLLGARCPEVQGIGHQLVAWRLMRLPMGTARMRAARKLALGAIVAFFVLMVVLTIALRNAVVLLAAPFTLMVIVMLLVIRSRGMLIRTGHTPLGMRYVVQLRRQAPLRSRLDGTVAGGLGLGDVAVLGLSQLTDYELLDVFRQHQVAAVAYQHTPTTTTTSSPSSACAALYDPGSPSWCGSVSCADSGFKGSSCAGPSSNSWSCSLVGGGSSCGGGGGGSSCGGSSGGSSCGGGGGGGSSCGGGSS